MHEARLDRREALILQSEDLYKKFAESKDDLNKLIPQSRNYPLRIVLVVTAIFVVITIALSANGISWKAFPGKLKHLMQTPVNWKTGIILGSVGLLISGATFIIYRVTLGKGKFWGDQHYKPVVLRQALIPGKERVRWNQHMHPHKQLVDYSRLENGTGQTTAVERKEGEHDLISFAALIIAPIQTVASVAYNAIRFCVVPFYILFRMAQEAITGKPSFEGQRKFKLVDIPKQMALSIYWAVRAPFYGLAYIFAIIYSFIDPMGGRKAGGLVTNEWMEGVDRWKSVWICIPMDGYKWEGGGGPEKLGYQAYYLTGCWMPWATVEVTDEAITRAYYPGEIFEYDIYCPGENGIDVPNLVQMKSVIFHHLPKETTLRNLTLSLPLGHYRYVRHDEKLYLIAHVTKRADCKNIFIEREIQKEPPFIDPLLNESVANNEGIVEP